MQNSDKTKLLLIPFFLGLVLMVLSWYLSYPVPASGFVYNHISILYWLSLPLLLGSMFLMALITRSNLLKWILSVGFVLAFFSLFYFYYLAPGPDSQYFRAMTEYFIQTRSLDASKLNHGYYQWPAFFILGDIVTSISGIPLSGYEFLLFPLIGFFLTTVVYVYASNVHKMAGFLTAIAFFISVTLFIDYQAVPYSLALTFLFLLFILERQQKNPILITTMMILFAALLITHLFVPLFFVLYLLIRGLFERKKKENRNNYFILFLLTLTVYLMYQFTVARFSLDQIFKNITKTPTEYNYIISTTLAGVVSPVDVAAQLFSRIVTVAFVGLCVIGFIFLLLKRKITPFDKAILLTGISYVVTGIAINTLGFRGLAIVFIPLSLGAAFLINARFKKFFKVIFLLLICFSLFIPLHQSFNTQIQFQTKATYAAANYFINHYNWVTPGLVVSDFRTNTYIESKLYDYMNIQPTINDGDRVTAVLYTPEFVGNQVGNYSSLEDLAQGQELNLLYNDGSSYLLVRP